jgi:hypothetical protein
VKHRMNTYVKIGLILTALAAVALLSAFLAVTIEPLSPRVPPWEPRPFPREVPGDIELFYTIKTVVSSVNVTLLIFLLVTYINMYRKTQSEFTVGLVIFSLVLLLYALASNPIVHLIFGFSEFGLGPFAMLPDLFTSMALGVLLYLTFKY